MGLVIRTIGLAPPPPTVTIANMAYNMRRWCWLDGAGDGKGEPGDRNARGFIWCLLQRLIRGRQRRRGVPVRPPKLRRRPPAGGAPRRSSNGSANVARRHHRTTSGRVAPSRHRIAEGHPRAVSKVSRRGPILLEDRTRYSESVANFAIRHQCTPVRRRR